MQATLCPRDRHIEAREVVEKTAPTLVALEDRELRNEMPDLLAEERPDEPRRLARPRPIDAPADGRLTPVLIEREADHLVELEALGAMDRHHANAVGRTRVGRVGLDRIDEVEEPRGRRIDEVLRDRDDARKPAGIDRRQSEPCQRIERLADDKGETMIGDARAHRGGELARPLRGLVRTAMLLHRRQARDRGHRPARDQEVRDSIVGPVDEPKHRDDADDRRRVEQDGTPFVARRDAALLEFAHRVGDRLVRPGQDADGSRGVLADNACRDVGGDLIRRHHDRIAIGAALAGLAVTARCSS